MGAIARAHREGQLGWKTGLAPRLFLKKLVDLMDKVDLHEDFDPAVHYELRIAPTEMTAEEAEAAGVVRNPDEIELDLKLREDA